MAAACFLKLSLVNIFRERVEVRVNPSHSVARAHHFIIYSNLEVEEV